MKSKRTLTILLACLLVCSLFAGCGAAKNSEQEDGAYAPNAVKDEMTAGSVSDKTESSAAPTNPYQKLVRKVWLEAETEDIEILLTGIGQQVPELGGYVETRDVYNGSQYGGRRYRTANLTIRIPAEKLDQFVQHVSDRSNITSNKETADDITLSYVATESRITALQTEQTRLLELLSKAESMADLLEIEQRLTQVRTELEQVKSQLQVFDNQVSYGTIYLSIREVKEFTVTEEPETVWQRIGTGFLESLKNLGEFFTELFVALVVGLPYLVLIGALLTGLLVAFKLHRKKKKTKQDKEER